MRSGHAKGMRVEGRPAGGTLRWAPRRGGDSRPTSPYTRRIRTHHARESQRKGLAERSRRGRSSTRRTRLALFLELAFDRVVALALAGGRARGLLRRLGLLAVGRCLLLGLLRLVHQLADLLRGGAQLVHRGLDPLRVVALQRLAQRGDLLLDVLLYVRRDLVTEVADGLLDRVGEGFGLVPRLDPLDVAAVLLGVGLCLL